MSKIMKRFVLPVVVIGMALLAGCQPETTPPTTSTGNNTAPTTSTGAGKMPGNKANTDLEAAPSGVDTGLKGGTK